MRGKGRTYRGLGQCFDVRLGVEAGFKQFIEPIFVSLCKGVEVLGGFVIV